MKISATYSRMFEYFFPYSIKPFNFTSILLNMPEQEMKILYVKLIFFISYTHSIQCYYSNTMQYLFVQSNVIHASIEIDVLKHSTFHFTQSRIYKCMNLNKFAIFYMVHPYKLQTCYFDVSLHCFIVRDNFQIFLCI